ncbi:hypothetical protein KBZ21_23695 [Streptomyces sp. A73]|uniref:hypothetical protein n=1 Tax=Streptomyces smyrnaeus TaxID=1387713 RepID=UPI000C17891C|nr:hypothetical protein [Streptomyces sp. A73]
MTLGSTPVRGDYVVDESTRKERPPEPAWVGRVQTVIDDEWVRLVNPHGAEWITRNTNLSEACAAQRAAYAAAVPHRVGPRP